MTAVTMDRNTLWSVDSRTIVYSAIGAALYGVLVGLFKVPLPGTTAVDVRPAFALVPFFGFAFGPVAGFFTGLAPLYLAGWLNGSIGRKAAAGAIAGAVGVVIGFLIVFSDMIKDGLDF